METPLVTPFSSDEAASVYEPAEDSFLLIDALEKELPNIVDRKPTLCLEVGSGSGIISTAIAKALGSTCHCIATDINPKAANMTKKTSHGNGVHVEAVVADLVEPFLERLQEQVDLLLFNPPYVVTSSEEVKGQMLTRSWAGGEDGREVIDRLAPFVPRLLSPKGLYYLLVLKQNKPDDICRIMEAAGMQSRVVISRRCGAEFLSVLCFHK